jgi:molecular chaperone GrpE
MKLRNMLFSEELMTGAEASAPDEAQPVNGQPQDPSQGLDAAQLSKALAEAQQLATSHKDQYLRALAELDNVRKRAQRDVENANRYGLEKFAVELLPVLDSLQAAIGTLGRADAKSLAEGQEATLKLLVKAFEKLNIRQIDPVGEPFDPARHEAVMAQESATAEPNSVLQVVQPGFELAGRLLRPARVIVARGT